MIKVRAPDGTIVNFPDTMSREEIRDVMRQKFPPQQAAPSAPIDSPPTLGPSTATPMTPTTFLERLDRDAGRLSEGLRGVYAAGTEGASLGARDEILGLADAALGRGSVEEMTERRAQELEAVPSEIRIPAEAAGALLTAGPAGVGRGILARSVAPGAVYGYNVGEGTPQERLPSAALGAVTAGAADVAGGALARMISPRSTPQVQTMREMNVPLTPGQAAGGGVRRLEEGLKSAPVLGDFIKSAERRGLGRWQTALANRALAPAGGSIPAGTKPGEDLVNAGLDAIDDIYSRAIPAGTRVNYTQAMRDRMEDISADAAELLDDAGMRIIRREIGKITQPGSSGGTSMTGARAQEVLSELRRMERRYSASPSAAEQNVGDILGEIENLFQEQLEMAVPDGEAVRNANRAYANWLRVENAIGRPGVQEGLFTGNQLLSEVRRMARSRREFNRGRALMQPEARAGQEVLSSTVPDSGTPFRSLATGGLIGGGGLAAGGAGMIDPMMLAGGAAALATPTLAYTRPGQAALAALIAGRQGPAYQRAAEIVRRASAPAGVVAAGQVPR